MGVPPASLTVDRPHDPPVGRSPEPSPDRFPPVPTTIPSSPAFSVRLDTDDPHRARALLRRYAGAGVELVPARSAFRFRFGSTGDTDVALQTSAAHALVSGTVDLGDQYVVLWLTGGRGAIDVSGDELPLQIGRPVLLPPGPVTVHLDDARLNHVHIGAAYLDTLADETDTPGRAPWGSSAGTRPIDANLPEWNTTIRRVAADFLTPVGPVGVRRRRAGNRALAVATLQTFTRWADTPTHRPLARAPRVQRAIDFIEGAAREPIGTGEIAAAVGLSARGLQQAFQRDLGTTPHEYLRDVRLMQVRQELLARTSTRASVSSTATRWGFAHLGRFSAAYRARFDELPSTTLRR